MNNPVQALSLPEVKAFVQVQTGIPIDTAVRCFFLGTAAKQRVQDAINYMKEADATNEQNIKANDNY